MAWPSTLKQFCRYNVKMWTCVVGWLVILSTIHGHLRTRTCVVGWLVSNASILSTVHGHLRTRTCVGMSKPNPWEMSRLVLWGYCVPNKSWHCLVYWNRAVIWFPFPISSVVFLPSPHVLSVLSFCANCPFSRLLKKILKHFSLGFFVWLLLCICSLLPYGTSICHYHAFI